MRREAETRGTKPPAKTTGCCQTLEEAGGIPRPEPSENGSPAASGLQTSGLQPYERITCFKPPRALIRCSGPENLV